MTIFDTKFGRVLVRRLRTGQWEAFGGGKSATGATLMEACDKWEALHK